MDDANGTALAPLPCFVHIPKTGGNTLRRLLLLNYGDGLVDHFISTRNSEDGSPITASSESAEVREMIHDVKDWIPTTDCVALNLPYGLHAELGVPLSYFSLLRQPVERCVSYWYFAYNNRTEKDAWSRLQTALARAGGRIEGVLDKPCDWTLVNDQTRMILGSEDREMSEAHLEAAKQLIHSEYLLVGALERLDESVDALARHFGWRIRRCERMNVGDRRRSDILPSAAREAFAAANEIDAALYRWVVDQYLPRRLAEMSADASARPHQSVW